MRVASFLLAAAFASVASAAPPEAPKELRAPAGKVKEFVVKADGTKKFGKQLVGGNAAFRGFPGDNPGETVFWLIPETDAPLWILWVTEGETVFGVTEVNKGADPAPPPKPKPDPPGPGPAPKGFRVIFVYETSQPLPLAMQQVMFGERVRTYLDAKTIKGGNQAGWRRWDKDVDATNEKDAEVKALWQAARPHVTTVPCVIVAVDGKAEILPLPASEDAALELFRKYAEGK